MSKPTSLMVAAVLMFSVTTAVAQNYPIRPIRIVTSEVGGGNHTLSRMVGQGIAPALGQPVVIENRPAGLEAERLSTATPDGYTLVIGGSTLWLSEIIEDKWRFRVFRDYVPITLATTSPLIVTVNPALPVNSIKDLIALAKAKPGALNYGSGAIGASSHLGPELFKSMADINIVRVPYKGTGPAYTALMANEVQLMISNAGSAIPYIKSGRLKGLAVTSPDASPLVPGMPTVSASGLPGYESVVYQATFTTANTPPLIIKRLNHEIAGVLRAPETRSRLLSVGVEAIGSSPEEAAAKIKAEMARIRGIIKSINLQGK